MQTFGSGSDLTLQAGISRIEDTEYEVLKELCLEMLCFDGLQLLTAESVG